MLFLFVCLFFGGGCFAFGVLPCARLACRFTVFCPEASHEHGARRGRARSAGWQQPLAARPRREPRSRRRAEGIAAGRWAFPPFWTVRKEQEGLLCNPRLSRRNPRAASLGAAMSEGSAQSEGSCVLPALLRSHLKAATLGFYRTRCNKL